MYKVEESRYALVAVQHIYFHMAVKVNMQLTTRFISAGEHNIINIDLKAIMAFFRMEINICF